MKTGQMIAIAVGLAMLAALGVTWWMRGTFGYKVVNGLTEVTIGGKKFPVSDYVGLDNPKIPSRLRGCFKLSDPKAALAAGEAVKDFVPYAQPSGFDCWKPEEMHKDLKAGKASAVRAETAKGRAADFERIVVIYPDGRAFQQRRLIERK